MEGIGFYIRGFRFSSSMKSRRSFLGACAGAVAASLAGCINARQGVNGEFTVTESSIKKVLDGDDKPRVVRHERVEDGVSTLVVEGTVVGRNGCFDDVSLSTKEEDSGALEMTVNPVRSNPERRFCTEALVSLGYRATVKYRGKLSDLTVKHGGVDSGSYDVEETEE